MTKTQLVDSDFATFSRPKLAELLGAIGLDIVYEQGCGDTLIYRNVAGEAVEVLDMLGGFGAGLFGHNHPALSARAQQLLTNKRPFLVQGSTRASAGRLARRLSDLVGQTTGHAYVTTFANSGTEAVEAALKHAALARVEAAEALLTELTHAVRILRVRLRDGAFAFTLELYRAAEQLLEVSPIDALDALEYHLMQRAEATLFGNPCYVALRGAFHGKTTGSLKLTYNRDFRLPWQHVGLRGLFTPRNNTDALAACLAAETETFYKLIVTADGAHLEAAKWSNVQACIIEPIQGEGGIYPLEEDYLLALRQSADQYGFPLIIDEIQSGMGRTGHFLASTGVRGDYYTFSKSLGGSLAKIGAMLVQRDQYVKDFGYLHTSTFADDDFSSEISLAALDVLTADDGALIDRCGTIGDYLIDRLKDVQRQYPTVIQDVRGRGLMVGLELVPVGHSPLLRVAAEQNLLGFLLCGYLLHEHQIRVTPTVSATNTIRIEPSAYIKQSDVDRFCAALSEGASLLETGNAGDFLRYLTGSQAAAGQLPTTPKPSLPPDIRRVACIAHFIEPQDVGHFDQTLGDLNSAECSRLLKRTQPVLEPFVADERVITSPFGVQVGLVMIGIPYTAEQIDGHMRAGTIRPILEAIEQAVQMAKEMGCMQVGFTGYTSIVTNNCTGIIEDSIGLTSGNSLTAAAASEATHQRLAALGISVEETCLGIVGGVGNIGRVLAQVEGDRVGRMILFGRRGRRRLERLADDIYAAAWHQICHGGERHGIARTLVASGRLTANVQPTYKAITALLGQDAPITVSLDLNDLQQCNAIMTATNAAQPIITPELLGDHPTVICDVAVPNDVASSVTELPHVEVIKGGILQLPLQQQLDIRGLVLPVGQAYACVSETLLLGLAGVRDHFSYGNLRPERVRQIGHLARQHGFAVVAKGAA